MTKMSSPTSSFSSSGSSTAGKKKQPPVKVKSDVWIPMTSSSGKNEVFELAKVVSMDEQKNVCRVRPKSGQEHTIPLEEVQLTNPRVVADMTSLYHINDAGILHNLKVRSERDLPYTSMGSVLVSVNPLHAVPDPELKSGQAMTDIPHPYAIAENAFRNMVFSYERRLQRDRQLQILQRGGHDVTEAEEIELVVNQSVVISGESGSGKTESGKRVLRHLVNRACVKPNDMVEAKTSGDGLDVQLSGVGPILEAFGNASTVCNHNSSRFGKFSKLHFVQNSQKRDVGKTWNLVGATVETYLLEQSRVVNHSSGERNFHVFYQLISGADDALRESLGLNCSSNSHFRYLRPGSQLEDEMTKRKSSRLLLGGADENSICAANKSPGLRRGRNRRPSKRSLLDSSQQQQHSYNNKKDKENFENLTKALKDIGKDDCYVNNLFKVVAGVLHLGNIAFEVDETLACDAAKVCEDPNTKRSLSLASKLLGIPDKNLQQLMLTRHVKAGVEVIETQLDVVAAQYARDALAKWTYGIAFDFIVQEINAVLTSTYDELMPLEDVPFIGVLDIFGFESFRKNGFEQLLINYTNESLQSTFNYQVFVAEADLYKREGLILDDGAQPFVCPEDDGDCLDLFEGKPGMTGLLVEIDSESRGPRPTDDKLNRRLHSTFGNCKSFPRPHPKDVKTKFLIHHYAGVVEYTIGDFVEKNNDRIPADMNQLMKTSNNIFVQNAFLNCAGDGSGKGFRVRKKKTVVANFGGQIRSLVETLESTKCSFIRCVKPNPEMVWARNTNWFNCKYVNEQLKNLSIPQTAAVLKSGLPTRIDYSTIVQAYQDALPRDATSVWQDNSPRTFTAALFWAFKVPNQAFRLGLTKVFFQNGLIDLLDRIMTEAAKWAQDVAGEYEAEKLEVVKRFKLYYARSRWRGAFVKVVSMNHFTKLLHDSRNRANAVRRMQRCVRAAQFRGRIQQLVEIRRRKKKQQQQADALANAQQKQEEKPTINTIATNNTRRSVTNLTLSSSSPASTSSSFKKSLPPLGSQSSIQARQSYRSGKQLSGYGHLGALIRTPKGSLNKDFLELVDQITNARSKELHEENKKLQSDLEELKQDIQLLKKQTPFTHVLHIY